MPVGALTNKSATIQTLSVSFQMMHLRYYVLICCALLACSGSNLVLAQNNEITAQEWHYTLRPADKLQDVGKKFLNNRYSWTDIVHYNHIDNIASVEPGSIIRIPMQWLKHQPKPAKVMSISGSAQIKRINSTVFNTIKSNMPVYVGDEIATRNGTVLIKLADGSIVRLEKNSNLVFNKLSHFGKTGMVDTRIRLKKGTVSSEVSPLVKGSRYEITTPSAVAAVRGTKFRLESSQKDTKIEVTEGSVDFSHRHGKTIVQAGEGARIKQGSTTIERSLLPAAPTAQFEDRVITDLPATLKWKDQQNAQAYRYELTDKNNTRLQSAKLDKPNVNLDHVNNGNYKIALRAIDNKGFEGIDATTDLSVNIPSETAELLKPLDSSILDIRKPAFSWKNKDSSTLSKLEIAYEDDFSNILTNFNFEPLNRTTLQKDLPPGEYFWHVLTLSDDMRTSASETRKLTVLGRLKPVRILSVNYIDNQVGLFWMSVDYAERYVLQISNSSSFQKILKEETLDKTKAHLRLTPGKRYYARVKAVGDERFTSDFGPVKELFIKD